MLISWVEDGYADDVSMASELEVEEEIPEIPDDKSHGGEDVANGDLFFA